MRPISGLAIAVGDETPEASELAAEARLSWVVGRQSRAVSGTGIGIHGRVRNVERTLRPRRPPARGKGRRGPLQMDLDTHADWLCAASKSLRICVPSPTVVLGRLIAPIRSDGDALPLTMPFADASTR